VSRQPGPGHHTEHPRTDLVGRYTVNGSHLDYVDDTGFTATGDIRGGVLYHEHLVLYKEEKA
jgi:hypothetical protein